MNSFTQFAFQRRFACTWLVLISAIFYLQAQQPLTLQQALAQAQNNQLYQARLEQIEVLKGRLQQAEKRPNPRVESEFETGAPLGESENYLLSLLFSQTWERGGKRGLRRQIAQSELEQAILEAEDHMRILISQIRLAYLELLQLQRQVSLLETHAERINKVLQLDQVRVREGEIPAQNPEYLRAELTELTAQKGKFQTQRWLVQYQLNALIGAPVETEYVAVEEEKKEIALPSVDALLSFASRNRSDLRKMRSAIQQADLQVSMEKAVARRDWELGLGYHRITGRMNSEDFFPPGIIESADDSSNLLEMRLTIPLPLWDDNSGNLSAAMAAKKVKERELAHAEFLVRSEVLSAYQEYQFNQQRDELYRRNLVPKLQENLQRLEAAYQLTGEEVSDWLGVQRDLLYAALQGLTADFHSRESVVKLEQGVGGSLEEVTPASSP